MSEVKRYAVTELYGLGDMREEPQGEYVRYEDYARLKAEVERLTKAGDALAGHTSACYRAEGYDPKDCFQIDNWNAAKQGGKQ